MIRQLHFPASETPGKNTVNVKLGDLHFNIWEEDANLFNETEWILRKDRNKNKTFLRSYPDKSNPKLDDKNFHRVLVERAIGRHARIDWEDDTILGNDGKLHKIRVSFKDGNYFNLCRENLLVGWSAYHCGPNKGKRKKKQGVRIIDQTPKPSVQTKGPATGWICPKCETIWAPSVTSCNC